LHALFTRRGVREGEVGWRAGGARRSACSHGAMTRCLSAHLARPILSGPAYRTAPQCFFERREGWWR
jgi:hypothetical protein